MIITFCRNKKLSLLQNKSIHSISKLIMIFYIKEITSRDIFIFIFYNSLKNLLSLKKKRNII